MYIDLKEALYWFISIVLLVVITSCLISATHIFKDVFLETAVNSEYALTVSLNELQESQSTALLHNLKVAEKKIAYTYYIKRYILSIEYNGGITDCEVSLSYWNSVTSGGTIPCMLVENSNNAVNITPYIANK